MAEQENTIRIAVVEEQIKGIREQQRSHNDSTQRRFDDIDEKIDALIAVMNRGRGAYAASLLIAGVIGGFLLKVGSVLVSIFQR